MSDCASCNALQSEVVRLRSEVGYLRAGVASLAAFINREIEKPTMPRQQLIPNITERLNDLRGR